MNNELENIKVTTENRRFDYLDNIKWVLAVLVIFHHSASITGFDDFPIHLPTVIKSLQYQYGILGNFQDINQGYFMSLFFLISAYFVIPSYSKKGTLHFIKDKFKRLGIPVLLTIFLIDPIGFYFCDNNSFFKSFQNTFLMYGNMLKSLNMLMGVTWFCWTLLVFNLFYIAIKSFSSKDNDENYTAKKISSIPVIIIFAIIMIPFNYLGSYLMKLLGGNFLGFHDLIFFPMYIVMFYFGILAYRYKWLDQITYKYAFAGIIMWLTAKVFLSPIDGSLARSFTVIGMSIFLLYSFKVLFNTKNEWTKKLSRSAYAAYVIQVIPLCFIGKLFIPYMTQMPVVNFLIVGIISALISFVLAHFICKLPLLRNIF